MLQYQEAITVTDTYHETKSALCMDWRNRERASPVWHSKSCRMTILNFLTLYVYEGYNTVELSKVYGIAHQNISKRIIENH